MQWPWKKDFKVLKVYIIFTVGMQLFLPKLSHSACDLESGPANTLRWSNPRVTAGNKLCKCQRSTAAFRRFIFWRNKLNPSFLGFFFTRFLKCLNWAPEVYFMLENKKIETQGKFCWCAKPTHCLICLFSHPQFLCLPLLSRWGGIDPKLK